MYLLQVIEVGILVSSRVNVSGTPIAGLSGTAV
jgi:hypothetical protein